MQLIALALVLGSAFQAPEDNSVFLSCDAAWGSAENTNYVFKLENGRLSQYSKFSGTYGSCDSARSTWKNCKTVVTAGQVDFSYHTISMKNGVPKVSHLHRLIINRKTGQFLWNSTPLDKSSGVSTATGGMCRKTSDPAPTSQIF